MRRLSVYVALAFALQSCMFLAGPLAKDQADKNLTAGNNAIPIGIGKDNTYVVAVLQGWESRDKYVRKYFRENYNGDYVFATVDELEHEYADVNKYRYAFMYSKVEGVANDSIGKPTSSLPSSNYFIYDRKQKREYNSGFSSSMFGKVIDAYTRNMEEQRLANVVEE